MNRWGNSDAAGAADKHRWEIGVADRHGIPRFSQCLHILRSPARQGFEIACFRLGLHAIQGLRLTSFRT